MDAVKVIAITSTRSDYDLLSGVYSALDSAADFELGLIVGGAHLAPTYGRTVQHIRADGFSILAEIESLLDSDSIAARPKGAAIYLQSLVEVLVRNTPDVVLYAGDREDALAAAMGAAYLKIPSVHFFGGDHASDGNVDNPVRHAVTKLSSLHLVSNELHAQRIKALGEAPARIQVVGSPALDKFRAEESLTLEETWQAAGGTGSPQPYVVVIHHAILGSEERAAYEANLIMDAIVNQGLKAFVSSPNPDAGSREIMAAYQRHERNDRFTFYSNLPRRVFVNLLRQAKMLIGNSSLGLLEAPSIPIAAVNVGARQRGRLAADNVIFVDAEQDPLSEALKRAMSAPFQEQLKTVVNPYGDGNTVLRVVELLRQVDFATLRFKKEDPLRPTLA